MRRSAVKLLAAISFILAINGTAPVSAGGGYCWDEQLDCEDNGGDWTEYGCQYFPDTDRTECQTRCDYNWGTVFSWCHD